MLPTRHLLEFLLTVYILILILIPGPSVVFVVSRGVWGAPRAGWRRRPAPAERC